MKPQNIDISRIKQVDNNSLSVDQPTPVPIIYTLDQIQAHLDIAQKKFDSDNARNQAQIDYWQALSDQANSMGLTTVASQVVNKMPDNIQP